MRALIRRAPRASGKKFVVELIEEGRRPLHIQFGDASMEDYTQHHNRERRAHYIARHRAREHWTDPRTAGFWSRFLLWGESTSLRQNARAIARALSIQVTLID